MATVIFHRSDYRRFKAYYTEYIIKYMGQYFPGLVSYNRFAGLMQTVLLPLCLSEEENPAFPAGAKAEGAKRPELFIFIAEQRIQTFGKFGAVKPNTFSAFHLKRSC